MDDPKDPRLPGNPFGFMNSSNGKARPAPGETPSRLLLVRMSAMGDIIHVIPAYSLLRNAFPEARIDWLVESRFAPLIRDYPGLSGLIEIPRGKNERSIGKYWEVLQEIRRNRYDAAIDFQGLTKSALWPFIAGIPLRVGYGDEDGREVSKVLYNKKVIPSPKKTHVVDRNLELARSIAGDLQSAPTEFPTDIRAADAAETFWRTSGLAGGPVVGMSPGAGWETKVWPAERFGELASWFKSKGWECLVLWGPGEEELAKDVQRVEPSVVVAPPTDFNKSAELIRRTRLFVAGDTGPLHLAAFLKVPCVGLYGASDPRRNGPYGVPSRVVSVDCAETPCWKTRCPKGDSPCLSGLSVGKVVGEIGTFVDEVSVSA